MEKIDTEKCRESLELIASGVHFNSEVRTVMEDYWRTLARKLEFMVGNPIIRGEWNNWNYSNLTKAASVLSSGVNFEQTPEGPKFWDDVVAKLRSYGVQDASR